MATPGVKWEKSKLEIVEALKLHKGRLTYVARHFDIAYDTLMKSINADSQLLDLVKALRNDYENTILDLAENCVVKAMENQDKDPNNAIKSSFFVLNSKGKARGWTNTFVDLQNAPAQIDIENKDMEIAALKAKLEKYERNAAVCDESETESKLPGSDTQV